MNNNKKVFARKNFVIIFEQYRKHQKRVNIQIHPNDPKVRAVILTNKNLRRTSHVKKVHPFIIGTINITDK